ncbi:hypothetical protein [Salininema proteolyticum]|uniref:Uncharacterized protein n=1 Tax=Salininema proteolyticum TaxID=1607685 RepID=A0ABV8TZG7_9ACTN
MPLVKPLLRKYLLMVPLAACGVYVLSFGLYEFDQVTPSDFAAQTAKIVPVLFILTQVTLGLPAYCLEVRYRLPDWADFVSWTGGIAGGFATLIFTYPHGGQGVVVLWCMILINAHRASRAGAERATAPGFNDIRSWEEYLERLCETLKLIQAGKLSPEHTVEPDSTTVSDKFTFRNEMGERLALRAPRLPTAGGFSRMDEDEEIGAWPDFEFTLAHGGSLGKGPLYLMFLAHLLVSVEQGGHRFASSTGGLRQEGTTHQLVDADGRIWILTPYESWTAKAY